MKVLDEIAGEHGRYRLQDEVGAGGMGRVFLASDGAGARVAVKTVKPDDQAVSVARFQREAALLKNVHHPHVLRYRDAGLSDGQPFVVTDFIAGVPLGTAMAERTPEHLAAAAPGWARELAAALAAVHAVGILHRDVKPANALVRDDGSLVLVDFGLARSDDTERPSASSEVHGTLPYLAPELHLGKPATAATDVYGWALVAYEMLCRRRPFDDLPPAAALEERCARAPEVAGPPQLAALARLVQESLAPDPAHRPRDGRALLQRLEREVPLTVARPAPPDEAERTARLVGDVLPVKRVGGWQLIRQIARGGNSTVYEARRGDQRAALKVAGPGDLRSDADRERFAREARVLGAVDSPHVVRVLESGVDGNLHYIAMEALEGDSLAVRLKAAPFSTLEAWSVLLAIAEGVAALHRAGIVHRDLKPGNVVLTADGPRLVDFGLARRTTDPTLTGAYHVLGTRGYAAPEVVDGQPAGPAADVYALGVIACELFTRSRELLALAKVDPRLAALVDRATLVEPAKRPKDAGALLAALRELAPKRSHAVTVFAIVATLVMLAFTWAITR